MARTVSPQDLRIELQHVLRDGTALVEYYYAQRDPLVARAVDRAARWLAQRNHAHVAVLSVDMSADTEGHLDRLRVKVLPQPTTVALYRQLGQRTQLWAGRAVSSTALAQAALAQA